MNLQSMPSGGILNPLMSAPGTSLQTDQMTTYTNTNTTTDTATTSNDASNNYLRYACPMCDKRFAYKLVFLTFGQLEFLDGCLIKFKKKLSIKNA